MPGERVCDERPWSHPPGASTLASERRKRSRTWRTGWPVQWQSEGPTGTLAAPHRISTLTCPNQCEPSTAPTIGYRLSRRGGPSPPSRRPANDATQHAPGGQRRVRATRARVRLRECGAADRVPLLRRSQSMTLCCIALSPHYACAAGDSLMTRNESATCLCPLATNALNRQNYRLTAHGPEDERR